MKLGEATLHSKEALSERLTRVKAELVASKGKQKKYKHSNGTKHLVVTDLSVPEKNLVKFLLEEYDARCNCGF